jgi:nucleotide-binding universal stress UspA family protein
LAHALAKDHGAKLILLHVVEPMLGVINEVGPTSMPAAEAYDQSALEARLKSLLPNDASVTMERRIVLGSPSTEIIAAAKDGCDLIVLGTHGYRGLDRLLLGSVAEQVMRKAPCPVLAVKAGATEEPHVRKILYATDFSEQAQLALHLASWLAREYKAHLTMLHVVPPPAVSYGDEVITAVSLENAKHSAAKQLALLQPTVPSVHFDHQIQEGEPAEKILDVARWNECDLIVMGTHGRSGLGRLLLGSVAEQVVRRASCSVLTVKAPLPQTAAAPEAAAVAAARCEIVTV